MRKITALFQAELDRWRTLLHHLRDEEHPEDIVQTEAVRTDTVDEQTLHSMRQQEREAEEALARLRAQYHAKTQPLTVARARVDVMRRGYMRGGSGSAQQHESG